MMQQSRIEARGLRKRFAPLEVLCGVDLVLPQGEILGLIGPSGGGKSVLLKILGGVSEPDSGSFDRAGILPEEVSLMFQEGALFDSLSVFDNVAFPLVKGRVPSVNLPHELKHEVAQRVGAILERVGLSAAAHKMPGQISGGMRRRVSLARALVCRPKLLLLDDPTSGLDPVASSVIMNLILELHKQVRATTVIVSHDLRRLLPVVDQVAGLFHGRISFCGSTSALARESDPEIKAFVSCRFDLSELAKGAHGAQEDGARIE